MTNDDRLQLINDLQNASPLEVTDKLIHIELYDVKSSQEIIDEVYKEFENGGNIKQQVLMPVFLSVADGLMEAFPNSKQLRKKGLTPQRIVNECEAFSYENPDLSVFTSNAYVEYKNSREFTEDYTKNERGEYDRSKIQNQNAMNKYKEKAVKRNNGEKNLVDEYTGEKNITAYRNNADARRNDPTNRFQAQPDHIVPLKEIHNQLAGNCALSDNDIRIIANVDGNLALTSAKINQEKRDSTNSEYVKSFNVNEQTKISMLTKEQEAQKIIEDKTNDAVKKNLTFQGIISSDEKKQKNENFKKENGREPSPDEKAKLYRQTEVKKTMSVYGQVASNAGEQAANYAIGNVVLFAIKPIYYEFKDIFTNGFSKGVGTSSGSEALKIRFNRIKKYMMENVVRFIGDNLIDFIKGFISSLIEGIISMFVGIFKQVLKVVKEGIKVFVQSAKILFGKDSSSMTAAQKGDAIVKILGGTVIALAGIGIEALLNKIGIGDPWSIVLSTMMSGIASAIFMYLLDKIDLFSVKAEQRYQRIKEIFDERIEDIEQARKAFNIQSIEVLKKQRIQFDNISSNIKNALAQNDIASVNDALYSMANFYNVNLPYKSTQEFVSYFDKKGALEI